MDPIYTVYVIYDGALVDEEGANTWDEAVGLFESMKRDWKEDVQTFPPQSEGDGVYLYDCWEGQLKAACR